MLAQPLGLWRKVGSDKAGLEALPQTEATTDLIFVDIHKQYERVSAVCQNRQTLKLFSQAALHMMTRVSQDSPGGLTEKFAFESVQGMGFHKCPGMSFVDYVGHWSMYYPARKVNHRFQS